MIPKVKISMYALEINFNGQDIVGRIIISNEDHDKHKEILKETLEKAVFTFSINNNAILYYVRAIHKMVIEDHGSHYKQITFKGIMELRESK